MTAPQAPPSPEHIAGREAPSKIMVVSTPKTGNTWMKHLLSAIYDLPIVPLGVTFTPQEVETLGERWIGQEHYYPTPRLLKWAQENGVVFVTTVRHPGDTFLSLYHYTLNFGDQPRHDVALLQAAKQDGGRLGANIAAYVKDRFFCYPNMSIAWMQSGQSHVVRYEDLWRDPHGTLSALTSQIWPVSEESIQGAISRSDITVLRQKQGHDPRFFRKGSVGEWRQALPGEIIAIFRAAEPYPTQFAALGYTLDFPDASMDTPAGPRPEPDSVLELTEFDNGTPFARVFANLYLSLESRISQQWPPADVTNGPATFYNWINEPADEDPASEAGLPVVTNLAAYIHFTRPDIRRIYPDLYGENRVAYLLWFQTEARSAYDLHEVFVRPVAESFMRWAVRPSAEDPYPDRVPIITTLAAYLHRSRPDLQTQWPDLYDQDRIEYARWFIQYPRWEYGFERACLLPVLLSWANGRAYPEEAREGR